MGFHITVRPGGQTFLSEEGETLLDAALRQGVLLPHGCRDGACGACRGKVLSGSYDGGAPQGGGFSATDHAAGEALFCRTQATSDLVIESRDARARHDPPIKTLPVRVERLQRLAPEVMLIELKLPGQEVFEYRAGQYLDILLKDGRRRAFSLAAAAQAHGMLQLHVRHVPGGVFTEHVFGAMREREILRIRGPYGDFGWPPERARPALLIAGGTGFAPIKALVEQAIGDGLAHPLTVYWGGRRRADLYLADLAERWARDVPGVAFVPVLSDAADDLAWSGRRGLVHAAAMEDHPDMSGFEVYVCGPPALVSAARRDFVGQCHLSEHNFFSDSFEFARDGAAAPSPVPHSG